MPETIATDSTPMFIHDCGACKFLGTTDLGERPADLYFHSAPGTTVIARYSSEEDDYVSGLALVPYIKPLAVAAQRALQNF